eukprot:164624-Rhodomonas_salina.1
MQGPTMTRLAVCRSCRGIPPKPKDEVSKDEEGFRRWCARTWPRAVVNRNGAVASDECGQGLKPERQQDVEWR